MQGGLIVGMLGRRRSLLERGRRGCWWVILWLLSKFLFWGRLPNYCETTGQMLVSASSSKRGVRNGERAYAMPGYVDCFERHGYCVLMVLLNLFWKYFDG